MFMSGCGDEGVYISIATKERWLSQVYFLHVSELKSHFWYSWSHFYHLAEEVVEGEEFYITDDNAVEFIYVDGEAVDISGLPNKNNWQLSDTVTIPEANQVIAVQSKDVGGKAGFLASSPEGVLTNSNWKCSNTAPEGW